MNGLSNKYIKKDNDTI